MNSRMIGVGTLIALLVVILAYGATSVLQSFSDQMNHYRDRQYQANVAR